MESHTGAHSVYPQVVGIGLAVMDYLGIVPRLPKFDEAEAVTASEWLVTEGGPAGTAIVTIARLGGQASFIGLIGDDLPGRQVKEDLERERVDTSCLRLSPLVRTYTSICAVEAGTGKRAFLAFRDPETSFELEEEDLHLIRSAQILHLDSHYPRTAVQAAQEIKKAGGQVSLDAYRIDSYTPELVHLSDVLIAAEGFPERYTQVTGLEQSVQALLDLGPRLVVITLGGRGCYLATRSTHFFTPGFPVQVIDTTGAGDVFHGAFLFGLLEGWSLKDTALFANAAGALVCTELGGRTAITGREIIEEFLSERKLVGDWNRPRTPDRRESSGGSRQ